MTRLYHLDGTPQTWGELHARMREWYSQGKHRIGEGNQ